MTATRENAPTALDEHKAELTACRTILQNLLLEIARETGSERLNAIREASIDAIAAMAPTACDDAVRHHSAALVHQCFDQVAAQAGFTIPNPARGAH
jgi:hypothetical protein